MKVRVTRCESSFDIDTRAQYRIEVRRWYGWVYLEGIYAHNLEQAKAKAVNVINNYRERSKPVVFEI